MMIETLYLDSADGYATLYQVMELNTLKRCILSYIHFTSTKVKFSHSKKNKKKETLTDIIASWKCFLPSLFSAWSFTPAVT